MSAPLLTVRNLSVSYDTPKGRRDVVSDVSFEVGRERVGIVGESGSGKTQTGRAVLKITGPRSTISADRLEFCGTDLLRATPSEMRTIRGRRVSMVLQDPRYALNPVMSVGRQIAETYRVHFDAPRDTARQRALEMLSQVGMRDPEAVYELYPHQVSGGMGQRVMISMMLISDPELLIADEPTSALDVTIQLQVLELLDELVSSRGMGLIMISHDLKLVSAFCDRVLVMYKGRIVETVSSGDLDKAEHPYTRGLLDCRPRLEAATKFLPTIARDPTW